MGVEPTVAEARGDAHPFPGSVLYPLSYQRTPPTLASTYRLQWDEALSKPQEWKMRLANAPDFKAIRQKIPIIDICKLLNITLKRSGAKYSGKCPLCSRNAFKVTPARALFWCFSCEANGDGLALYSKVMKLSVYEAAREIERKLGSA
jgi:hypothetical protein